ncbi:DegT/DnrJ/EryC1/StrS family aminotransferase [Demetria terragena]|uniref:DegT/DnrJ/EryC1/StrS family aminotransferase n=1 Tax=Demetria terragena TaxID=63959 RepID=UPI00037B5F74|nr:aminotransferase class V-fold PLP-dependent enzyme [Demetria terragena]
MSMLPYGRQSISDDDVKAVAEVLRGDWLTTGPAVDRFEKELGAVAGQSNPAVAVTSGTAALHVAYAAAGVGPGDEVITSPLTFLATATSAAIHGATVVFADVCEDTGNLDPAAVEALVTDRTKVISGVDFAGHPMDAPGLRAVADQAGALLLEDAAHSIGGSLDGRPVGSLADLTTFSFFPTKNLTTAEGGAVVALDPDIARKARTFKGIGMVRDPDRLRTTDEGPWWYEMPDLGLNYRLPDVLCALGSSQLTRLSQFKARRAQITQRYHEGLADVPGLRLPTQRVGADPVWHFYPLRVLDGRRRGLFERLRAEGIGVQVNYIPVHWQPWFADRGYQRGSCPVAETYYEQEISLPMFPDLLDADVDRVIDGIRRHFGA